MTVGTPQFANRGLSILASGWNVAGILSARSGAWLTVMTLRDIAANGILQQRVDQVLSEEQLMHPETAFFHAGYHFSGRYRSSALSDRSASFGHYAMRAIDMLESRS